MILAVTFSYPGATALGTEHLASLSKIFLQYFYCSFPPVLLEFLFANFVVLLFHMIDKLIVDNLFKGYVVRQLQFWVPFAVLSYGTVAHIFFHPC